MAKIVYLFPGQGSQSVGMGQDLAGHSPAALKVFDEADGLLDYKISTICFYGPEENLKQTVYTQPALFVASVATLESLREAGLPAPEAVAGHSIGEYAALYAAGAYDIETGLHLVNWRAQEMHRASLAAPGAMAAPLGLDAAAVADVCKAAEESGAGIVDVANYNCPGQVIISGEPAAVEKASELAKERGAKKVSMLAVSGAFHSRLMAAAAQSMRAVLADAKIADPSVPVVANLTADYERTAVEIKENLAAQIDHSVRWEESIGRLVADGFDTFVEVGPGKVLTGLMKRLAPDTAYYSVNDTASLQALKEALG